MSAPNIRPKVQPHTDCWRQDPHKRSGFVGDVRNCPHGKVQILTAVPNYARTQGPGTHYWDDLSPFWNWARHRQAARALAGKQ